MTLAALALVALSQQPTVDVAKLKTHVEYLAADARGGRGTPSEGLTQASDYIGGEFHGMGLQRLPNGTYYHTATYQEKEVRTVMGIIPGSDEKLKNEYVFVSAHYDGLGTRGTEGDTIYNGANDNASGTAGVIETARALKGMKPKRTVVFALWWGEERGLLGSREYVKTPVFPLKDTVAMVNYEQIGRTDDAEGPRVNAVAMTGQDYSDVGKIFTEVGKKIGVEVQKHPRFSDAYFGASDNAAFARVGIPAHTICTAFAFDGYHQPHDNPDKLDYANMAKVVRLGILATLEIANAKDRPKWDETNPKTERYRNAGGG